MCEARDAHLDVEPCGQCDHLGYDSGFWCKHCLAGQLSRGDYHRDWDKPLVVFLGWLTHNQEGEKDCSQFKPRRGRFEFVSVTLIQESVTETGPPKIIS